MQAAHLIIDNILGIKHLEFDLGKWNEVTGANATGKTSVLESIKGALGGGSCAELIRNGEKKGQIVLVMDTGHRLQTDITHKDTKRHVRMPPPNEKAKITAVKDWLGDYLRASSFNPISFIEADKKKRMEMLLEIAPLSMTYDEYAAAAGKWKMHHFDEKNKAAFALANPLDHLDELDKRIREYRRNLNSAVETLRAHASELEKAIPQVDGASNVKVLKDELASLTAFKDGKIRAAKQIFDEEMKEISDKLKETETSHRQIMEQEILEARDRFDRRMNVGREAANKLQLKAGAKKDDTISKANSDDISRVEALVKDIGAAEEKAKLIEQAKTTMANIEKARTEAATKSEESSDCTIQLASIADARAALLEKLPIEGMSIRAGEIHFKDVLFDTLNTAQQIDVAFQLAEKSAGQLKLVIMDGLEALDDEKMAEVKARAEASPCQFVVTRVVSGQELAINAEIMATAPDGDIVVVGEPEEF